MADDEKNLFGKLLSGLGSLLGGDDTNFVQKIIRGAQVYGAGSGVLNDRESGSFMGMDTGSGAAKLSMASVLVGGSFDVAAAGFAGEKLREVYKKVQAKEIDGAQAARESLGEVAGAGAAMMAFRKFSSEDDGIFGKATAMIGAVLVGKLASVVAEQGLKLIPLDKIFGGGKGGISGGVDAKGADLKVAAAPTPAVPPAGRTAGQST